MQTVGRRERKKAQTRQALSEAAWRLFLARGFDQVTVAQVADEADTSIATLFKHFPGGKETLIFDDGSERSAALVTAVRQRPAGQPILRALREFLATRGPFVTDPTPEARAKTDLIVGTPALRDYVWKLWALSQEPLAGAIAAESGRDPADMTVRALARFVLEIPALAGTEPEPQQAMNAIFDLLEKGWPAP